VRHFIGICVEQTLDEEKQTDDKLTSLADRGINTQAKVGK
jgi:ferritin-like metal-binding protein YciE